MRKVMKCSALLSIVSLAACASHMTVVREIDMASPTFTVLPASTRDVTQPDVDFSSWVEAAIAGAGYRIYEHAPVKASADAGADSLPAIADIKSDMVVLASRQGGIVKIIRREDASLIVTITRESFESEHDFGLRIEDAVWAAFGKKSKRVSCRLSENPNSLF